MAGNVPANPRTLEELVLPNIYDRTLADGEFLRYDSGPGPDRSLIFASDIGLQKLADANHGYAEGTFKSVPRLFGQLYTIHAKYNEQVFQMAYALLPNKQRETYDSFLQALLTLNEHLVPATLLTDFKLAAARAFQHTFPGIVANGCFFHHSQNVFHHVPESGLLNEYTHSNDVNLKVRMITACAFVPSPDVIEYWELVKAHFDLDNDNQQKLIAYFEKIYIGSLNADGSCRSLLFAIEMWKIHENTLTNDARSNNTPEAWYRRFNHAMTCSHPTMWPRTIEQLTKRNNVTQHLAVFANTLC